MTTSEHKTLRTAVEQVTELAETARDGSDGAWLDADAVALSLTWGSATAGERDHEADARLIAAFGPDTAQEVVDLLTVLSEDEYADTPAQRAAFRLADQIVDSL